MTAKRRSVPRRAPQAGTRQSLVRELKRRTAMLKAIGMASHRIGSDWRHQMTEFLRDLGQAAEVSRASLFQTHMGRAGYLVQTCRFDWADPPLEPMSSAPLYQEMCLSDDPDRPWELGDWSRRRQRGEVVQATINESTGLVLQAFVEAKAKSFISVPIMVKGQWWGFLGFDDCRRMRRWSDSEIDALRTATGLISRAIERDLAESEARRREAMMAAIARAAPAIVAAPHWQGEIRSFLRELGEASSVSRVTLFEAHRNTRGEPVQSCRFDWAEPPLVALSADRRYHDMPLSDDPHNPMELGDWSRRRQRGEIVAAHLRDLKGDDRRIFLEHGTLSFVSVPVMASGQWWGFLGFDDCKQERDWSSAEIDVLQTAAALIGGAIEREQSVGKLKISEERYALAARGANDGLWDWDIGTGVAYFSPRLHQLLDLDDGSLGNRMESFRDILVPEDGKRLWDLFAAQFLMEKSRIRIECRLPDRGQGERHLVVRGLIVYEDQRPRRVVGSVREITNWVRSQRQLREAEATRARLARYFSPNMVDELMSKGGDLAAVRQQPVTVLFADIMGFSALTAGTSAEHLMAQLRDYLGLCEEAVFAHGGTLDKFLGDGFMATFGTPQKGVRDASNAVSCALDIGRAVVAWNVRRFRDGLRPWKIGIGIHSGPVVLGDIGSARRMEFAVVGDTVNIASRIEAMTRTLGHGVILSDATAETVKREGNPELLRGFGDLGVHDLRGYAERLWGLKIEDLAA